MACLFIARLPAMASVEAFEGELVLPRGARGPLLQTLKSKCRELARADSSVLVSPTTNTLNASFTAQPPMTLWIMAKRGHINDSKLKEKLQQLGLQLMGKVEVGQAVIHACYRFSLTARLAPKWNQMTSWLVQGSEFLATGRAQAVVLEVGMTKNEITLSVSVSKLTFNFLQPEDLEVSVTTLNEFRTNPYSVIRETSIYSNRCILLPNLTMGYIFSASHQLPHSLEFPSYDQIRVHWKKQHGFILPEKQSIFFQVFFKSNSRNFFSYPGCCVLKGPPIVSSSRDTGAVASTFIADVHARMPTLCGEAIRYSSKALTPSALLQSATRPMSYPNVRPAPPTRPASMPRPLSHARNKPSNSTMIQRAAATAASTSSGPTMCASQDRSSEHMQTVPQLNGRPLDRGQSRQLSGGGRNGQAVPIFPLSQKNSSTVSQSGANGTTTNTRVVPVFKPSFAMSKSARPPMSQPPTPQTRRVPVVPSFKPTPVRPAALTAPLSSCTSGQSQGGTVGSKRPQVSKKHSMGVLLPPAKRPCVQSAGVVKGKPSNTQLQAATSSRVLEPPRAQSSQSQRGDSQQEVPDIFRVPTNGSMESSFSVPPTETGDVFSSANTSTRPAGTVQSQQRNLPSQSSSKKTTIQVDGVGEEVVKKISKAKVPVLKKWLQENGVKCPSRKKEDLVRMAALHIRDTGKTFSIPI